MSPLKKFLSILCLLTLSVTCTENDNYKFQYSNEKSVTDCDAFTSDLAKELYYTFENFVLTNYRFNSTDSPIGCYFNFFKNAERELLPMGEKCTDNEKAFLKFIQSYSELWIKSNKEMMLNNTSDLIICTIDGIKDKEIRNTIRQLNDSNTLTFNVLAPYVLSNLDYAFNDSCFMLYVSLITFYEPLRSIDFDQSAEEISQQISAIQKQRSS